MDRHRAQFTVKGVVRRLVAERRIADDQVKVLRRDHHVLETAIHMIRIRVELLADGRRGWIQLDGGHRAQATHCVWHEANEVARTRCRLQDLATSKADALQALVDPADHHLGRVVRVLRRPPGLLILRALEKSAELVVLGAPFFVATVERLREAAPPDVPHQL